MSVKIVKVQRPISPPDGPWLIYDKARLHIEHRPSDKVRKQIKDWMGNRNKAYFRAAWSSIVGWGISAPVEDRDW